MISELDPVIRSKLLEFRARFRGLVFARGMCCTLLGLLGGLLLLSLADYLVLMEDHTRYALSSGVYITAMVIAWVMCIRPLLRVLDESELAVMIEKEEPTLKSKLLSAVELAQEEREHESAAFRKQAQLTVVENLRALVIYKLLPAKLVQVWLAAAVAMVLVTGLVAASESGRTLLLRALMPAANIDRVSRNQILVLTPEGGNAAVPENDEIQIRIRVQGPEIKKSPYLLAERSGEQAQKAMFTPDNNPDMQDEYITTIAVESQDVTYRVHAGDAVSRRYTLISRERPQVVQYGKTYTFPGYTGRTHLTVKEGHGNISALSGTNVKLTLHLNQPVKMAMMDMVTETATNKLNFVEASGPKQWVLDLPLLDNGAYKIYLMTAEKLGNKSPVEYSIEAKPDLVPTVELIQPGVDVTARPENIISIIGEVKDDIGLARWEQLFKVGKADWKPIHTNLFNQPLTTNAVVKLDWDLLKRKVKVGSTVLTKLAVIDRKGSRTESRPVRVKVESALFEVERIETLNEQRLWTARLNNAVAKTLDFCNVLPDQLENLLLPGENAVRRTKAAEAIVKLVEAKVLWTQTVDGLPSVIRKARPGRECTGFSLIGRLGVRLESDWFPRAQMHLMPLEGIVVDPRVNAHFEPLPDILKNVRSANKGLSDTANIWLAADEAAVAIDLLDYIQRAAERMHRVAKEDKDTDEEVWIRLLRRQASAGKELNAAKDVLKELASRLNGDRSEVVSALHDDLNKVHEHLVAKHAEGVEPDATLLGAGLVWSKAINDARDIFRPLTHELASDAAQARENLDSSVGTTAGAVRRLGQALKANEQAKAYLNKAKKEGEKVLEAEAKLKVLGELSDLEWIVAQEVLRGCAQMEESGSVGNALFVSDVAQAAVAIGAVREGVEAGRDLRDVEVQLEAIIKALTTLEAAHELALLEGALKNLANRERWEHKSTDANSLRPRDWEWLARRLAISTKKLRKAGLAGDEKLGDIVRGAAAKAVAREMKKRQVQAGFFVEPKDIKPSR